MMKVQIYVFVWSAHMARLPFRPLQQYSSKNEDDGQQTAQKA
jgi:hypothetical protein